MDSKKFLGLFIPRESFYLWVILMLVAVIAVLEWHIAIPGFILFAFLTYYYLSSNHKRRIQISSYIENLNFNIDTATKDTLLNFPLPLVITETDGSIVWYNSSFKNISGQEDECEKVVRDTAAWLNARKITDGSDISREVTLNGMQYQVLCNFVGSRRGPQGSSVGGAESENDIYVLYFIDITELVQLRKTYADEKIMAGIIVIDNYDDLMQSMPDANRPQMLAEIDKKVVRWTSFTNGILKKYDREKYLFLFESKYMKELEEKKFDILDTVKEINTDNRIPVTLSLGFGMNGKSLSGNLDYAAAAIDVALGRGGDQVVVKNGDSFRFFGGKTREVEKRTKVKARVIAYALRELINQSQTVLIMGHENADVDSLGASLGLYRLAVSRDKRTFIVLNKINPTIESLVSRIQKSGKYENLFISRGEALEITDGKTLLIIVDTHRPSFTEVPELIGSAGQVVVIDHHRRGADYIQDTVLLYQETYASSTCELVTEILQYFDEKLKLNPVEAEGLYAGIVVDTKNFTFKTGVRTFEAASWLRRQGVDTVSVKQLFQNDLTTYTNISDVVKSAEMINNEIAISECPAGMKNVQLIAAKSADELLSLSGIAAAFVLCSAGNEIWISGRSLGDINVQMILEKLGGGGHLSVAGAQLSDMGIGEAKDKLKYAIMEYVKELNKPNP